MVQVTLPVDRWDSAAVLLMESVRTLHAESHFHMAAEVAYNVLPAIVVVTSPAVRLEYAALLADIAGGCPQQQVA